MKDLFSFLNEVSGNSDFKATLSKRGGFITFQQLWQTWRFQVLSNWIR